MRKAPILRFKGFTNDWEQRKLGDCLKVNSGKDYKHLNPGNIPVFGTGGYMLSVNKALSYKDAIGIGRKGTINKPQLLIAPFWTVDTLFFLTPKEDTDLYFLFSFSEQINWKKYDESTGLPSLSKKTINAIKIRIPLKNEQAKIGTLIKKVNKLISLQQRKLRLLHSLQKETEKRVFNKRNAQKVGWHQKKIKDIFNYERPDKYIVSSEKYVRTGIPVLTANKSFILGYTTENNCYDKGPAIIFDDFTLESKFVDFKFMIKSSAIKILTVKTKNNILFCYKLLKNTPFLVEGHSRHYISKIQPVSVYIPNINIP